MILKVIEYEVEVSGLTVLEKVYAWLIIQRFNLSSWIKPITVTVKEFNFTKKYRAKINLRFES